MKNNKIEPAMMHCYRELYANATPPASFDELLKTAEVKELNQKINEYLDYEISEELFEDILQDTLTLFFITGKNKQRFKNGVLLGPCPKFKKN